MNFLSWPGRKPLRMVWYVEKDGRASHLVGTAHFFPYSYRHTFVNLMKDVNTVMFEGPLDETSSAQIADYGRNGGDTISFVDQLTPDAVREIDRLLRDRLDGQSGNAFDLSLFDPTPAYFEMYTKGIKPWAAFFSIWQTYLGWEYSMDLEGYQIACKLGKQVKYLESLSDQIKVLDSIPLERIVRQLNDVKNWKKYKTDYVKTFLAGDLESLVSLSSRFATRGPAIVGERDRIFFEGMKPVFERENALALVGFPHIPGVAQLLCDDGFTVTQVQA
jgi:uncharacterized protein YbaP (TraB family)